MQALSARQELDEIIGILSENKLKEVIDFAGYLKNKEEADELIKMQMNSKAYSDWLSPENDIYNEVFKDGVK